MGASTPPLVVAVVEDDPPSRTALGRPNGGHCCPRDPAC